MADPISLLYFLPPSNAAIAEASRRRLGVSTPPLSDETHTRNRPHDSDSDDSETLLPWARPTIASDDESEESRGARSEPSHMMGNASSSTGHGALGPAGLNASHLPPSPISSAESPITQNDLPSSTARTPTARRPQPTGRRNGENGSPASGESSRTTSMTSDSDADDDQARGGGRGDYTFSIYDVYGRDSVAFPNFALFKGPEVSPRGNLPSGKSMESLPNLKVDTQMRGTSPGSAGSTPEPRTPREREQSRGNANGSGSSSSQQRQNIPTNLRSPSGRRPSAAPDPRAASPGLNLASSLRKKVEAAPAPGSGGIPALPEGQQQRGPGNFDPRRRPSAANAGPPSNGAPGQQRRPGPPNGPPQRGMSNNSSAPTSPAIGQGQMGPPSFIPGQVNQQSMSSSPGFGPSSGPGPRPGMQVRGMSNSMRRRSQSVSNVNLDLANGNSLQRQTNQLPSPRSPFGPNAVAGMRSSGASGGPMRSSSDRSSERERTGSKELKKNPSNPQPGLHGGMSGLSVAYPSRSPSPLTNVSDSGRLSPSARSSPGDTQNRGGSPFDGGARPPNQIRMPNPGFRGPPGPGTPNSTGGVPSQSGMPMQMNGAPRPAKPEEPVAFDSLGFVIGSGPTFPPQPEDPEAREKWSQVLSENDLAAVRKSRKVKKMIQTGVPALVSWFGVRRPTLRQPRS